ncbi:MAG: flavodoxin family protein [Muribaculaceae bacterium]|nr:flavodoxin family protein [Muribaculaceae bacterium]
MEVLIISSSPRKGGNSDSLSEQFKLGAENAKHKVTKVFLGDKQINYCKGCNSCFTSHKCIQKDDMEEILQQMVEADIIVLATPIYFYAMCGQLKVFIDRCCARYTEMSNKRFYYLFTAAENGNSTVDKAIIELQGFLDCLDSPQVSGIVSGLGAWKKGEISGNKALKEAYDMGKNI